MQPVHLLIPVFVQVGLTFFLAFWMARERVGAIQRGEVRTEDIALGQKVWPPRPTQCANAFTNQFELPVLFYAVVAFALITSRVDVVILVLAWLFVLSRIWHAFVHTTSNTVRLRFRAYATGVFVLLAMWIHFAVSVIAAGLA
jgi:hypothetical protein